MTVKLMNADVFDDLAIYVKMIQQAIYDTANQYTTGFILTEKINEIKQLLNKDLAKGKLDNNLYDAFVKELNHINNYKTNSILQNPSFWTEMAVRGLETPINAYARWNEMIKDLLLGIKNRISVERTHKTSNINAEDIRVAISKSFGEKADFNHSDIFVFFTYLKNTPSINPELRENLLNTVLEKMDKVSSDEMSLALNKIVSTSIEKTNQQSKTADKSEKSTEQNNPFLKSDFNMGKQEKTTNAPVKNKQNMFAHLFNNGNKDQKNTVKENQETFNESLVGLSPAQQKEFNKHVNKEEKIQDKDDVKKQLEKINQPEKQNTQNNTNKQKEALEDINYYLMQYANAYDDVGALGEETAHAFKQLANTINDSLEAGLITKQQAEQYFAPMRNIQSHYLNKNIQEENIYKLRQVANGHQDEFNVDVKQVRQNQQISKTADKSEKSTEQNNPFLKSVFNMGKQEKEFNKHVNKEENTSTKREQSLSEQTRQRAVNDRSQELHNNDKAKQFREGMGKIIEAAEKNHELSKEQIKKKQEKMRLKQIFGDLYKE